jgi:hypothetical protein
MIGIVYTDEHIHQIAREDGRDLGRRQEQREWERLAEQEEESKAREKHQEWLGDQRRMLEEELFVEE